MAATHSTMLPLGSVAPDFRLPDTISDQWVDLQQLRGQKATLIMFICNHCPYVIHVKPQLIAIARHYQTSGVATIAISANDIGTYPEDGPTPMKQLMAEWGNPFAAYLYDESQAVAHAYQAACTPDFYLFDADLRCVYRGRLDASTPKNQIPLSGQDLRAALDALLSGQQPSSEQWPSVGCNIKWKQS